MRARALAALLTLGLGACAPPDPRPSVILVSIDTLRADHVGCYGYERDTTPFLDRWAEGALVFDRAYTSAPLTLIAHMTMLTGLFPQQHGVDGREQALSPAIPLLAERLRDAGYRTLGLYHEGWIHERHGFARGFDAFRRHESAEEAGAHLREELDDLDDGPFFLFLHLFDVHSGPFAEGQLLVYPSPPPFQDWFLPDAPAPLPQMPEIDLWHSEHALGEEQIEALVALYDGGIRHVDARLGEWFGELERRGLLENALVVVTSDHGEALAQRGRLSGHGMFYDEGLRVPLIVRHPQGLRAGERSVVPVHLADIVPTVLAAAGLASDARLPGRSLLGDLLSDRVLAGSRGHQEYLLRWPRKMVRTAMGKNYVLDLEQDPRELAPASISDGDFQSSRAEALSDASSWPAPVSIGPLPRSDLEALRALGYGGDTHDDALVLDQD